MNEKALTLTLNNEAYERIQQIGNETHRSLDSIVANAINIVHSRFPDNLALDNYLARFTDYTDDELWAIAHIHIPLMQEIKLQSLSEKGNESGLTDEEQTEMDKLLDTLDRKVLIRTEALYLLQKRGYDIKRYLNIAI